MNDFEKLLGAAYGEDFYHITVMAVSYCSFIFICSIPLEMKDKFIEMTEKAEEMLKNEGVTKVEIDGEIIIGVLYYCMSSELHIFYIISISYTHMYTIS